jgi:uncharacterized protein YdaU (DUF1376 family)
MDRKVNYYPFHLGDYAAHTAHLEPMEDLAYRRMLDAYYLRESALPADVAEVARLIRMRQSLDEVQAVLQEFFTLTDSGWEHTRCEQEIERMQDKQAKARASAAASVNARKANAQRTLNERSTDVELPTPTPTPTPKSSVPKGTGADAPEKSAHEMTKDELWSAGKSLLMAAGTPKAQCGSFVGKLVKDYGDSVVIDAVRSAVVARPADPAEYMKAICMRAAGQRLPMGGQAALEARNRAVAESWIPPEMRAQEVNQ